MPGTTKPARPGRKPADRKPPVASDELQAETLDGPPPGADLLIPPGRLRAKQRARLLKLATTLQQDSKTIADGEYEVGLDLIATIDDLLEKHFTIDRDAYSEWATLDGGGPNVEERIITLFSWYASRLGE